TTHSHFNARSGESSQLCLQSLIRDHSVIRARPVPRLPASELETVLELGYPVIWLMSDAE
ncbi:MULTISPECIES: hypothetical protein, partial [unclassified Corynebacterium]|uniref:hypothetical protein n=1 Tax=unclassified Corynebacterium TaxID=2624378 RepID=UPI001AEF9DFE